MSTYGFLAIWTEIAGPELNEYRRWLRQEHIGQRIFSPGFLAARVHAHGDNELAHFIIYATEGRDVLKGEPYINVINCPTPWTQRMMPRLGGFDRGVGEQVIKIGDGTGAWLAVSRIRATLPLEVVTLESALRHLLDVDDVVTARVFAVDRDSTSIQSAEKHMRIGNEGEFGTLLIVEGMTRVAVATAAARVADFLSTIFPAVPPHDTALYSFVYGLHSFERATTALRREATNTCP